MSDLEELPKPITPKPYNFKADAKYLRFCATMAQILREAAQQPVTDPAESGADIDGEQVDNE